MLQCKKENGDMVIHHGTKKIGWVGVDFEESIEGVAWVGSCFWGLAG